MNRERAAGLVAALAALFVLALVLNAPRDRKASSTRALRHGAAGSISSSLPRRAPGAPPRPSRAVDPSWWSAVQRELTEREYAPTARNGLLQAPNRAQNLRASFRTSGVTIRSRVRKGSPWSWSWRSAAWGRAGSITALGAVEPCVAGTRVEYRREGLVEWYENDGRGLEQGFTILSARPGRGPLLLRARVGGTLAPREGEPGSVRFLDRGGACVLAYGALAAYDAAGKTLPATLRVGSQEATIEVEDRDAVYPITIDPLITSPAWTAQGAQAGEKLGFSVATAGDVNGDGFSDVIVGAPLFDSGLVDQGGVFLYLGSLSGLSASASVSLTGGQTSEGFGTAVSPAGDTNGDGYGDVVVGAPGYSNGQSGEGRVYVYRGSPSGFQSSPWTAEADQDSAALGASVALAGDVNGDGFDDVLAGAPRYDNGQIDEGRAYLFLGGSGGLASTPQWTAEGDQDSCAFATSVAAAGDVNGDGFDDVVVGAPLYDNGETNEGLANVYLGSASGLTASPARTLESNQAGAQLGASVSTAGDVNGDGYADLLVGAPLYDNGQTDEGEAFLYLGSSTGTASNASWTAESNQAGAQFGTSVSTAGDVNGDGYADVIVGAPLFDNGQTDEGRAFAYFGSSTSLAATAGWTAESNQAGAQFGASVASAGDVNGDGYGDVIVGAPLEDGPAVDGGNSFVYLGAQSGPNTTPAWSISNLMTSSVLGFSVSAAGDVNADGYGDVIVGAPGYDNGQTNEGAAFVYLGSPSGLSAVASWSAESNMAATQFGNSVSAGDVNGDGYDDAMIGAPLYSNGQVQEGAVFVYYGSASGLGPNGTPANADWVAEGNRSGSKLGVRVAALGDVNGDGFADVAAGAYTYGADSIPQGRVYVYLGSGTGLNLATQIAGDQDYSEFGYCVAAAGDVNGDGFADLVASARRYANGNLDEGRVSVYYGSRNGISATAAWTAEADQDSAEFGYRVASCDVNGDGYSDIIVGAPFYDNGSRDEGKVFVYLGSKTGLGANGTPLNADWTAESNQVGGGMGSSVGSAGDLNGDGYGDIVIGASMYDNPEVDEGMAFVYYGSASGLGPNGTPANADWTAEGNQPGANLGVSATVAGDVNGDGFADLIVGADLYDTSPAIADNGRVLVYYGNGSGGLNRVPRQRRVDTGPLSVRGRSDSATSIRLEALGRSAAGRTTVGLQWELTPTLVPFDGLATGLGVRHDTGTPVALVGSAVALSDVALGRAQGSVHHWRLRILSRSPFFPRTPWFSPAIACPTETHVRTGGAITGVEESSGAGAPAARLWPAKPNPTGGKVVLSYSLGRTSPVRLGIYDVRGRLVSMLVDRMELAGAHAVNWSGLLPNGQQAASGVYFASLWVEEQQVQSRKIILAR